MSINLTGVYKYVNVTPGHAIVNGQVLFIKDGFRINNDTDLTSGDGDYYIHLRPNRKVMEAYYSRNYEVLLKYTTSGGSTPTVNPDEIVIGFIQKRTTAGITTLTPIPLNRSKRLIDTKDISDDAVAFAQLKSDVFTFLDGRKYQIKGDNSTDNITALANFAAALRDAGPGATGVLPYGDILTSGPLDFLGNGVRVIGHGRRATRLKKMGDFDLVRMYGTGTGVHLQEPCLEHMTLDGGTHTGRLIDIVYVSNASVDFVYGRQNNGVGLDVTEVWDSWFEHIVFEDVNSTTEPAIWVRCSRAASGFGSGTSDSDQIHLNHIRCESWKFGALIVDQGTGAAKHPDLIYAHQFKAESSYTRGKAISVTNAADNVYFDKIFVSLNNFDSGFSTPNTAIEFAPSVAGSLRDSHINTSTAIALDGVNAWTGAPIHYENISGTYTTAPSSGYHVNFPGGGPYVIHNCHAQGASGIIDVHFASPGMSIGPGARDIYLSQKQPASLTDGTNSTPTTGAVYYGAFDIPDWDRLTGLAYLVGTVGGTDKVIVTLYDTAGVVIANSNTAGVTVGTAATWHRVAFTSHYSIKPGRYFASVSFNGNTCRFRTQPAGGNHPTGSQSGTFGTLDTITTPTLFLADTAPFMMTYYF